MRRKRINRSSRFDDLSDGALTIVMELRRMGARIIADGPRPRYDLFVSREHETPELAERLRPHVREIAKFIIAGGGR